MKCNECNTNFKANRTHAKYCSRACQMKSYRKRKENESSFKEQEKIALGKVQEQQKNKVLVFDQQIHSYHQKMDILKKGFNQEKENEAITLIELKVIREAVKESEQEIENLSTILVLNDEKFYEFHCNDEELTANGWGFVLNGLINVSLMGFNETERNKEIKRVKKKIDRELYKAIESQEDDKIVFKELFQKLKMVRAKLKQRHKGVELLNNKIKKIEKQKLIPVKVSVLKKPIQHTNSMQGRNPNNSNSGNLKNGVGGTELQDMTFDLKR